MDHDWHYKYNRRLSCFSHSVSTVAFSQDGRWLVSATGTGDVKVWNTGSWAEAAKLKGCRREEPRALTISPAQRWLVCAYPSVMHIFDCQPPWHLQQTLPAPPDVMTKEPSEWCAVTFSPLSEVDHPGGRAGQDNHLAAFSSNNLCVLDYSGGWGADTPKRTVSIFSSGLPTSIQYTSCGSWLLCGFESGELQIWNHFSLTLEKSLKAHGGSVLCLTASPFRACYDPRFVSCSSDQSLRVWHSCGWILEQIVPDTKADRNGVRNCTFSCNGNWIVSVAHDLCVWAVCITAKGKMQLRLHQRLASVCGAEGLRTAAFCSQQDAIAVGSRDGVLGLWTKQPGAIMESNLKKGDSGHDLRQKTNDASRSTPWIMSRQLARPMMRLTPDGLMPRITRPMMKRQDWALRTNMRPLSMTMPANVASQGKLLSTPKTMRSVTQAGSATLSPSTIRDSPPPSSSVSAKLIAVRDRTRKTPVHDSPVHNRDGDTEDMSPKNYMNKSKSTPELRRWKSGTFEFGDVLDGYVQAKSDESPKNGFYSPVAKQSSKTLPPAFFEARARGSRKNTDSDGDGMTETRKSLLHATRSLVQRISLDPQAIC